MRIAFVVAGGFDESGRERVIPSLLWFVERMARKHDVVVYVLRYLESPRRYPLLGATVHDMGRPEGIWRQYTSLLNAVRYDGRPDVVHAYWALPAGLVATLVAARLRIPSVVTLDSGELVSIPEIGYGLRRLLRQRMAVTAACRLASRITVCTHYQERLAAALRVGVQVIPFGVDAAFFTPPAVRVEGPPWRLIHVASLNRVKNQALLVETMRVLIDRGVDAHLDIVGEDTMGGVVQDLVHTRMLDAQVTFHGHLPSDQLLPLYQRAHVALLPSYHEAAGVVTLEAAACGVATVGTNVGYIADWAPDAATAPSPPGPDEMAAAVVGLLSDRAARERIAATARAWTLAHDANWTAREFDQLYKELAEHSVPLRSRPA